MPEHARPTNTASPLLDPVLYWRLNAFALTLIALLGIVLASLSGGGAESTKDQALAFHGVHGLGFTWTHNVLHVVLALAAFTFGFAPLPARAVKVAAIAFGALYLGLGVVGFFLSNPFGTDLALDLGVTLNAIHVLLGGWALAAGLVAKYD